MFANLETQILWRWSNVSQKDSLCWPTNRRRTLIPTILLPTVHHLVSLSNFPWNEFVPALVLSPQCSRWKPTDYEIGTASPYEWGDTSTPKTVVTLVNIITYCGWKINRSVRFTCSSRSSIYICEFDQLKGKHYAACNDIPNAFSVRNFEV